MIKKLKQEKEMEQFMQFILFARKLGSSWLEVLCGYALSGNRIYFFSKDAHFEQTLEVKEGIYNLFTMSSVEVSLLCGLALLFLFPLFKKKVEESTAELTRRRNKIEKWNFKNGKENYYKRYSKKAGIF